MIVGSCDAKCIFERLSGVYTEPVRDVNKAITIPDCSIIGNGK